VDRSITDRDINYFVSVEMQGVEGTYTVRARRYFPPLRETPLAKATVKANLPLPFVTRAANEWRVAPGDWQVLHSMITPPGVGLRIAPGTTMRFASKAKLVVQAGFTAEGSRDKPIRLLPNDEYWPGVVVLGNRTRSVLKHVEVANVRFVEDADWRLTGAVTLWKSDIEISNSLFREIHVEDALNGVNCTAAMTDTQFSDTSSDAIDFDFCTGEMVDLDFENIGGDAFDISGSTITAARLTMQDVFDKAVSVGEASRFDGTSIMVDTAAVGIAAKDGSSATISESEFTNVSQAAYTAYIKKPEYTYATLNASDNNIDEASLVGIAIHPSQIIVDAKPLEAARKIDTASYANLSERWQQTVDKPTRTDGRP